jgi:hypothetical protein
MPTVGSANPQHQTKQEEANSAHAASTVKTDPAQTESRPTAAGDRQETPEEAIARYTYWLTWFTFIMAVGTLGLFGVTYIAAIAAKRSADALPTLERGYIFAAPSLVWSPSNRGDGGEAAVVDCWLANYGRTPVILWQFESDFCTLSRDFAEPDNTLPIPVAQPRPFIGGQLLGTEGADSRWHMGERQLVPPLDAQGMQALKRGEIFVWFCGRVTYEDVFGNARQTRFRWVYNGLSGHFTPRGGKPYNERT